MLSARRENLITQEAERLTAAGYKAAAITADVTDQAQVESLVAQGAIVNLSSVSGLRGYPELAAYTAAKHGVIGLSKGAAVEYAAQGIRVNGICPGWVETPMTAEFGSDPEKHKLMIESAPMHRTAQPEEIAETIFWLCSDGAGFITGEAIAVDGGQTI